MPAAKADKEWGAAEGPVGVADDNYVIGARRDVEAVRRIGEELTNSLHCCC